MKRSRSILIAALLFAAADKPGLFFTYDGEALDFRGMVATFRNILLVRTRR